MLTLTCPRTNPLRTNPPPPPPGVLYPFASREDFDFFQHLEMHMRQEHPPLLGRDHLAYRCGGLGRCRVGEGWGGARPRSPLVAVLAIPLLIYQHEPSQPV